MIRFRRATSNDLAGIAHIVREVWDQVVITDSFHYHIQNKNSSLWVAAQQAKVLGFASAFMTKTRRGLGRWEIDLIAVTHGCRGQGLGQKLIENVYGDGTDCPVTFARALIQVNNVQSQAVFKKLGFQTNGEAHDLLIWSPQQGMEYSCPDQVSLISVETLTYRGVWIEGLERVSPSDQRRALRVARGVAARESRRNTGAVIPAQHIEQIDPHIRKQANIQAKFYWFIKLMNESDPKNLRRKKDEKLRFSLN